MEEVSIQDALATVIAEHGEPTGDTDEAPEVDGDEGESPDDEGESPDDDEGESPDDDEGEDSEESEEDAEARRKREASEARGWRAEKRRKQRELREARDRVEGERAEIERARRAMSQQFGKFQKAAEAAEKEDFLGVAEALGVDPAKLNEALFEDLTGKDPKVRELERKLAEREKREAEQQREAEERQRQADMQQKIQRWEGKLAEAFESHPQLARVAQERPLIAIVRQAQEAHYDQTGEVLDHVQAWERVAPGLRREYDALRELFGDSAAAKAETSPDGTENKSRHRRAGPGPRKRKPKRTPRNRAEAGPPSDGNFDEQSWLRKYVKLAEKAED